MFLKLIVISIILVSLAFLGLGVQIFFSKKRAFPQTHISENDNMKKLNISCAKHDDYDVKKLKSCNEECSSCCSSHKN